MIDDIDFLSKEQTKRMHKLGEQMGKLGSEMGNIFGDVRFNIQGRGEKDFKKSTPHLPDKSTKAIIHYKGKKYPAKIIHHKTYFVIEFSPEVFLPKLIDVSFAKSKVEE